MTAYDLVEFLQDFCNRLGIEYDSLDDGLTDEESTRTWVEAWLLNWKCNNYELE